VQVPWGSSGDTREFVQSNAQSRYAWDASQPALIQLGFLHREQKNPLNSAGGTPLSLQVANRSCFGFARFIDPLPLLGVRKAVDDFFSGWSKGTPTGQ